MKLTARDFCLSFSLSLAFFFGSNSWMTPAAMASPTSKSSSGQSLEWLDFDGAVFARAKKENKLILLDLEAVWCHWCHVMAEETYGNADVIKLLNSKYLCVRVDQDARPDLSNKYEDYGWPATIIFDAEGHELLKHAGYIAPADMKKLLKESIASASNNTALTTRVDAGSRKDSAVQSALNAAAANAARSAGTGDFTGLLPEVRDELIAKHNGGYDPKTGIWGNNQTFLDFDSAEYAISRALAGDKQENARAKAALDGELNLLDPAFGGLYQYSTGGGWSHPHFEKVMAVQTEGLRLYCLAYLFYKDPKYLQAASGIANFLADFLTSPDGAFYTSQDADLKQGEHSGDYFELGRQERLKLGQPRIDKHIYSRENGLAINALVYLFMASGEKKYLDRAVKAATWIETNRALKGSPGGFSHDDADKAGPYLSDTLSMGRAFLTLYEATADRSWLAKAKDCADFISRHFLVNDSPGFVSAAGAQANESPGYVSAAGTQANEHGQMIVLAPQPLLDENVMLSRFANLLYQYTGAPAYREQAMRALRYLSLPDVVNRRHVFVSGILLADSENHSSPLHVTISGAKTDGEATALFATALKLPAIYKRVEWFDRTEGPLPNNDTELPDLPRAAAFSCGDGRCSRPAYNPDDLLKMVARLTPQ